MENMIGIYIHIPFCNNICTYCDFCKQYYNKDIVDNYLDVLEKEIKERYDNRLVKSIFIGGGTPSCLSYNQLNRLLDILTIFNVSNNLEYTMEANPESLTIDKIKLLYKYKVNRVSLGVESFNDNILKILGRNHNKDDVISVINNLKKYNINNINIDLIYGINDNIDIVKNDIDIFLSLDIPHISCYSLIIEKHTVMGINNKEYIDEDIEYNMYKIIENKLEDNNYIHYEISNYAKKGYQSIHNMIYWNNEEYLSFGISAVSYINNKRISNTKNMGKYLDNKYIDNVIDEDINTKMDNEIMLSLRMFKGLDIDKFNKKYNVIFDNIYHIEDIVNKGYIIKENNNIKINKEYMYISNNIILDILESRDNNDK